MLGSQQVALFRKDVEPCWRKFDAGVCLEVL